MAMRRGLGRGLSQLLGDGTPETKRKPTPAKPAPTKPKPKVAAKIEADPKRVAATVAPVAAQEGAAILELPITSISANTRQPRSQFDDETLTELADSIREFGIIQPLVVRPVGDGKYELIAGERRLRAAQIARRKTVPVIVRQADAQSSLELALIENVQREDISAIECAHAYRRLAEEFGMSQEKIAQRIGKSRVTVANTLRLLRLPEEMQDAVLAGSISEGHARALLMVESPLRQEALFERVLRDGLSVRETERLARTGDARPAGPIGDGTSGKRGRDPNWIPLEQGLQEFFGTPVKLQAGDQGGKITIDFYGDDDLQRILDLLGIEP